MDFSVIFFFYFFLFHFLHSLTIHSLKTVLYVPTIIWGF